MAIEIREGTQGQEAVTFEIVTCANCHVQFMLTSRHVSQLRKSQEGFYCPNGHSISYGKSDCDKTKAELEKTKKRLEEAYEYNGQLRRETWELKDKITEARKSDCPHCGKRYIHLDKHIKKHHAKI